MQPGTKFPFPDKFEAFERTQMQRLGRDDSNVEITYYNRDPASRASVTVYIFPVPAMTARPGETPEAVRTRQFNDVLASIKKDIVRPKVDARQIFEGEFELKEGGRTHKGIKYDSELTYNPPDRKEIYDFEVMLFLEGDWVFEYRISYPHVNAAVAKPAIDRLLKGLTWKEAGPTTGSH